MLTDILNLSSKDLGRLKNLSLRDGVIVWDLNQWILRPRKNKAIISIIKDSDKIIGWGLAEVCRWIDKHRMFVDIGLYVSSKYRKRGIGKKIMKELLNWTNTIRSVKEVLVHAHDKKSLEFFSRFGFLEEKLEKNHFDLRGQYFIGGRMKLTGYRTEREKSIIGWD